MNQRTGVIALIVILLAIGIGVWYMRQQAAPPDAPAAGPGAGDQTTPPDGSAAPDQGDTGTDQPGTDGAQPGENGDSGTGIVAGQVSEGPASGKIRLDPPGEQVGGFITLHGSPVRVWLIQESGTVNAVRFYRVPTGTETWDLRELLAEDKDPSDGWSFVWHFEGPVMDHLVAVMETPEGDVQVDVGVYYEPK